MNTQLYIKNHVLDDFSENILILITLNLTYLVTKEQI